MAYKIIISALAHNDEYEAYNWYEKQRFGLGEEFLNELKSAYNKLALNPDHYGFIDDKKVLRDISVKRFPYTVVYRFTGSVVEIMAVHHFKKHPEKKYGGSGS